MFVEGGRWRGGKQRATWKSFTFRICVQAEKLQTVVHLALGVEIREGKYDFCCCNQAKNEAAVISQWRFLHKQIWKLLKMHFPEGKACLRSH